MGFNRTLYPPASRLALEGTLTLKLALSYHTANIKHFS